VRPITKALRSLLSEGKILSLFLLMASRSVLIDFLFLSTYVRIIKKIEKEQSKIGSVKESMIISSTFMVDSCYATVEDNA
jgi:hypothetical protein